jgi:hypothetical protein
MPWFSRKAARVATHPQAAYRGGGTLKGWTRPVGGRDAQGVASLVAFSASLVSFPMPRLWFLHTPLALRFLVLAWLRSWCLLLMLGRRLPCLRSWRLLLVLGHGLPWLRSWCLLLVLGRGLLWLRSWCLPLMLGHGLLWLLPWMLACRGNLLRKRLVDGGLLNVSTFLLRRLSTRRRWSALRSRRCSAWTALVAWRGNLVLRHSLLASRRS